MKADIPKPEIEHFRRFHLLDLMSARHLNYLREKALVMTYAEGDVLFSPPRSLSMGYYLLSGSVKIHISDDIVRSIEAGSKASYCSLEEKLPEEAVATALEECQVLQLSRVLVEQYFSWSTTGEYRVVDMASLGQSVEKQQNEWTKPILNSPLAKNLSQEEAKQFFALFTERRVRKGDVLIHKGENNQHFFILKSGHGTLIEADDERHPLTVGGYFGDEALIPDAASSMQVEMDSRGVVAELDKAGFNKFIKKSLIQYVSPDRLDLLENMDWVVLDVRFPAEYKMGYAENSINIPVSSLRRRLKELDDRLIYFLSIESGARGELACYILQKEGFRAFVLDCDSAVDISLLG